MRAGHAAHLGQHPEVQPPLPGRADDHLQGLGDRPGHERGQEVPQAVTLDRWARPVGPAAPHGQPSGPPRRSPPGPRPPGPPATDLPPPRAPSTPASSAHRVANSTTRPRTPFTNRPDSSPEKVLASSMDSLMAALTGTLRATVIS